MKKFLLSIAAVACAASMSATNYTVYDIENIGPWGGDANGWGQTVKFGDKSFTLSSAKGSCTNDLKSPEETTFAWRIFKSSELHIESANVSMKQISITYDTYNNGQYVLEMTLSEGWTGTLSDAIYTLTSAGLNKMTATATAGQTRITKIVVSDETGDTSEALVPTAQEAIGGGSTPDDPELPEGVIYQNAFDKDLEGWEKINDESLSDFNGWKINNSPKCAICNSYFGGAPHAADSRMELKLDLKNYKNLSMSVEQAFGYDFPTTQVPEYTAYVTVPALNATQELTFANFPPKPESGNWTKEWGLNEFDLSEFDGMEIIIGFRYRNDGTKSGAWELKNFVVKGDPTTGIAGIESEENVAPVYYNLQGVRVENPENGLFIVVKGSKSEKVVF